MKIEEVYLPYWDPTTQTLGGGGGRYGLKRVDINGIFWPTKCSKILQDV